MQHVVVLIPAWQPDAHLLSLVEELIPHGFDALVIVDDGSDTSRAAIFNALLRYPKVCVLHHPRNLGKGRALKTGLMQISKTMPDTVGVITADADGQHSPQDIVRVAQALQASKGRMVLGSRAFDGAVPIRCRFGNAITRELFKLTTGEHLSDTQSGLRGIPHSLLTELSDIEGDRYEFEIAVLARLCITGRRPLELPIATVYLDDNKTSHFKPIRDSWRIALALIRSLRRSGTV